MAKRRSKEQQIADLRAKQLIEERRTRARAGVDSLKTLLHRREYALVLEELDELHDVVTLLAEDGLVPFVPDDDEVMADGEVAPVPVDRKSAAAGPA